MKFKSKILEGTILTLSLLAVFSCEAKKEKVEEAVEASVEFSVTEVAIPIGGTGEAVLNVTPADRVSEVEFSIADKEVISVEKENRDEQNGTISLSLKSGNSLGSTTIIALLDDKLAKCSVDIVPVAVESITLNEKSVDLAVGEGIILSASYLPENATSPIIIWNSNDDKVATVSNGEVKAVGAGTAIVTAKCGAVLAECEVTVHNVVAESVVFDSVAEDLTVEEAFILNATVLPENITDKTIEWTLSKEGVVTMNAFDAKEDDNILSATITAVAPGEVTITATIGGKSATCNVTVKAKELPLADPKIGDYFYSDGTWSDGGLISIKKDGTSPVWASPKPAPIEGKKVIGIVFQTDPSRLSSEETSAGHTHGLVMAAKLAHGRESNLTRLTTGDDIDCLGTKRNASDAYNDIYGQKWTKTVINAYPGDIAHYPAFDWTTTDFNPAAPANTSGWFVPSIGQLWDMMANLAGEEVAIWLRDYRTYDFTIYDIFKNPAKLTYNPYEKLNESLALVPAAQKEDFIPSRVSEKFNQYICELVSCTLYAHDGTCHIFWLDANGDFYIIPGYVNDVMVCRPVLAF